MQAQNVVPLVGQKPPRRLGDQHRAPVAGEKQDSILQVAENLIEILFQRGEDLFHIAHALADALDLVGDAAAMSCCGRLSSSRPPVRRLRSSSRAALADLLHRPQRQVAQQKATTGAVPSTSPSA
jgi:hypothetical protein